MWNQSGDNYIDEEFVIAFSFQHTVLTHYARLDC